MLTSKQRAYLRSLAHHMEPLIFVGKQGVTGTLIAQTLETLESHELIKCSIQQNLNADVQSIAQQIATETDSYLIQVIGRKFVLYKENLENPKINLV